MESKELKRENTANDQIKSLIENITSIREKKRAGFVLVFSVERDSSGKTEKKSIELFKNAVFPEQVLGVLEIAKAKELKLLGVLND